MDLVWQLLIPNLNVTTLIGILLFAIAGFGKPILNLLNKFLSSITGGKVGEGIIVSGLIVAGIILVWGVSIAEDLIMNQEFMIILAGFIFLIAVIIFLSKGRKPAKAVQGKLRL